MRVALRFGSRLCQWDNYPESWWDEDPTITAKRIVWMYIHSDGSRLPHYPEQPCEWNGSIYEIFNNGHTLEFNPGHSGKMIARFYDMKGPW